MGRKKIKGTPPQPGRISWDDETPAGGGTRADQLAPHPGYPHTLIYGGTPKEPEPCRSCGVPLTRQTRRTDVETLCTRCETRAIIARLEQQEQQEQQEQKGH